MIIRVFIDWWDYAAWPVDYNFCDVRELPEIPFVGTSVIAELDPNTSHIHQPRFLSHTTSWQLRWKFAPAIFSCLPCSMKFLERSTSSSLLLSVSLFGQSLRGATPVKRTFVFLNRE